MPGFVITSSKTNTTMRRNFQHTTNAAKLARERASINRRTNAYAFGRADRRALSSYQIFVDFVRSLFKYFRNGKRRKKNNIVRVVYGQPKPGKKGSMIGRIVGRLFGSTSKRKPMPGRVMPVAFYHNGRVMRMNGNQMQTIKVARSEADAIHWRDRYNSRPASVA